MDSKSFIDKAERVHGIFYDYSYVEFVSSKTQVIINCYKHGKFEQRPDHHLEGKGCYICGGGGRKFDKEIVIRQFKAIHGDKYDYSKTVYVNATSKITILCKAHQITFEQAVSEHKRG